MAESIEQLERRTQVAFIRRKLHIEKYSQQVQVPAYMFDDVDTFYDRTINAVSVRFSKRLVVDHLPGKTIQYPADWWEHFKFRWFPQWARKKYPIKWKTTEVNFLVKYPHYKLSHSQLGAGYLEIIERNIDESYNLYST